MLAFSIGYRRGVIRFLSWHEIPCCDIQILENDRPHRRRHQILENGQIKPSGVVDYMRHDADIGIVDNHILPNDDISLELAICQAKTAWDFR